ncbi:hypothetical protein U9M48_030221 [Paspalum notatum var. saurae]|uniref:Aminotransferase-like plant mobile domain-containing protein n=1 Tax=Paspalum notatum var. saurae TaxID=547442 RepID=A0AAQ3X322_PASNO
MAEELPTPELLDPVVDSGHRSYMSAVEHKHLATFQCRPPKEYLELDNRWLQRLRGAGLLTFCRLVEGGPIGRHGRGRPRLMIDNSLITALVDRTSPICLDFQLRGTAVGPRVVPASWKDDLEIRFAGVDRLDDLGALEPHPNARGPAKAWLLQFKATSLHPDTYDESVRRSLEAYLLWPFGFMMFKNGTSNSVDKRTWANEQARRTYPSFVVALDRLVAEDVIWEPYSAAAVGSRAPYGLSSLCTSNETLWYTTTSLVYDIYIEPHRPHELCDEFGLSRLGQPCSGTWVTKVHPYVEAWDNAHRDVVHPVAPHTDWWYETFLTWYRPRTRCHVTYADTQPVPHESSSTDAYARHRDEALAGA